MHAGSLDRTTDFPSRYGFGEVAPWAVCGALAGLLAAGLCAVFDGVLLTIFRHLTGVINTGAFWPEWAAVVAAIVAVLVSVVGFVWLVGLRKHIGHDPDSLHGQDVRRIRRYFLSGAIPTYLLASPAVWLVMIASAYGPA